MKQTLSINLKQIQTQKMTMQMIQSINMLMLTRTELKQTIDDELKENPALEIDESLSQEKDDHGGVEEFSMEKDDTLEQDIPIEQNSIDWEEYFEDSLAKRHTSSSQINYSEDITSFEDYTPIQPTLEENLLMQLRTSNTPDDQYRIGEYLISGIDESGYITTDLQTVADELSVELEEVEDTLRLIQSFEPPGIGARNLKECLLIQYDMSDCDCPIVREIITDHLELIAENKYPQLAKLIGVSVEEIQEAAEEIKKFTPKPGMTSSSSNDADYIIPDVILLEKEPGEYLIQINDSGIPPLKISSLVRRIINEYKKGGVTKDLYKYVKERQDSALWIIKSITQRRNTLYKISEAIVDFQKEFLDNGIRYLKPLTLKQLAEIVGVHESTVGRVTTGKYIQTPRGVFELKYFFTSGLKRREKISASSSAQNTDMASSESVKDMIREIIDAEDKKKPLSDQTIAEMLARKGIEIARRTVLKYRESMLIPASSKRKTF
ncbi:MAG: RNA polymerase sigma-54 factor [Candidatus Wallbacteria bacterium HGW-Wallbacteria-1]|jgi:RNA polymerase sigma-54 factor|uniref:RNA polymerase sigma-54 factor n=1 Tax=Candidatus Wallbacteria bacterium HGW-Wallbacteria-1 TaxID=2013854 RepID=A0A2N1PS73_9BACT|nr:MAG: RNA polymerase sigma-54 factor [Candidatus Wallbacteria bacterium HGW-Wallbacteria-1]